ncbi:50S ribosomal protein L24e [Candidatus Woesearchaeota archaeon]|nr:50S ribosomal protein L24e [Candidatus Woesearchaeota archaeon]
MICSYCGETIEKGTGKLYARKTGKVFYFCTRKCEKSMIGQGKKPLFEAKEND